MTMATVSERLNHEVIRLLLGRTMHSSIIPLSAHSRQIRDMLASSRIRRDNVEVKSLWTQGLNASP
jgi:hypothetical protein